MSASARTTTSAADAGDGVAPARMTTLRKGDGARVTGLDPDLPAVVSRRLLDLGFVPDTEVRCLRRAPLGSPTVYRVGETELCLRRSLSDRVFVEVG